MKKLNKKRVKSADSFLILLLCISGVNWSWSFIVNAFFTSILLFAVIIIDGIHRNFAFVILAVLFLIIPIFLLYSFIQYLSYKNWRKRLPFNLIADWDLLIRGMEDTGYWRSCHIKIVLADNSDRNIKAIESILTIFTNKANKFIYIEALARIDDIHQVVLNAFSLSHGKLCA